MQKLMGNVKSVLSEGISCASNRQEKYDNESDDNSLASDEGDSLSDDWFLVVKGHSVKPFQLIKSRRKPKITTPQFHVCYMSAIVLHESKVMFCGGMETDVNRTIMSSIISFDGKNWNEEGELVHKRSAPCAVSVAGVLYIIGGYNDEKLLVLGSSTFVDQCEKFVNGKCEVYLTENTPRFRHSSCAVTIEDLIYVIGGNPVVPMDTRWASTPDCLVSSTVNCLNTKTNQWMDGPSMNHGREDFAAVNLENKIFVFGGTNTRRHQGSAEFLDTGSDNSTWTMLPAAPVPLHCASSCWASSDEIVVLGGSKQPYCFNTTSLTWSKTISNQKSGKENQVETLLECAGGSKIFGLGM